MEIKKIAKVKIIAITWGERRIKTILWKRTVRVKKRGGENLKKGGVKRILILSRRGGGFGISNSVPR